MLVSRITAQSLSPSSFQQPSKMCEEEEKKKKICSACYLFASYFILWSLSIHTILCHIKIILTVLLHLFIFSCCCRVLFFNCCTGCSVVKILGKHRHIIYIIHSSNIYLVFYKYDQHKIGTTAAAAAFDVTDVCCRIFMEIFMSVDSHCHNKWRILISLYTSLFLVWLVLFIFIHFDTFCV